MTLLNSKR